VFKLIFLYSDAVEQEMSGTNSEQAFNIFSMSIHMHVITMLSMESEILNLLLPIFTEMYCPNAMLFPTGQCGLPLLL
jgi:hypothetical protein